MPTLGPLTSDRRNRGFRGLQKVLFCPNFLEKRGTESPFGGLVLTGKAADLKSAGSNPMGVRIPRPPLIGNRIRGIGFRDEM